MISEVPLKAIFFSHLSLRSRFTYFMECYLLKARLSVFSGGNNVARNKDRSCVLLSPLGTLKKTPE